MSPGPATGTALEFLGIAGILMLVGVASYVYEVLQKARPLPRKRKVACKDVRRTPHQL